VRFEPFEAFGHFRPRRGGLGSSLADIRKRGSLSLDTGGLGVPAIRIEQQRHPRILSQRSLRASLRLRFDDFRKFRTGPESTPVQTVCGLTVVLPRMIAPRV
jgi:hypothetical protein